MKKWKANNKMRNIGLFMYKSIFEKYICVRVLARACACVCVGLCMGAASAAMENQAPWQTHGLPASSVMMAGANVS